MKLSDKCTPRVAHIYHQFPHEGTFFLFCHFVNTFRINFTSKHANWQKCNLFHNLSQIFLIFFDFCHPFTSAIFFPSFYWWNLGTHQFSALYLVIQFSLKICSVLPQPRLEGPTYISANYYFLNYISITIITIEVPYHVEKWAWALHLNLEINWPYLRKITLKIFFFLFTLNKLYSRS